MIPLEDTASDILGKAQRGLAFRQRTGRARCHFCRSRPPHREGDFENETIAAIAPVIGLDASALLKLAQKRREPEHVATIEGCQFNTDYGDMTVNSYLIWTRRRVRRSRLIRARMHGDADRVKRESLTVKLILITFPSRSCAISLGSERRRADRFIFKLESAMVRKASRKGSALMRQAKKLNRASRVVILWAE